MDADRFRAILAEKRAGRSDADAARNAGVGRWTLYAWLRAHAEDRAEFDRVVHERRCEHSASALSPAFQGAA